jgi:hypothetical protein
MTTSAQEEQTLRKALAGSTTGMTFHSRAAAELALENQGRHTQGAEVTGSKPAVVYPRQPESSPWAADKVPPEPPLGYEINSQEPVGEPFEIEESLLLAASSVSPEDAALATEVSASGRPAPSALLPLAAERANFIRGRRL